MKVQEVPKDVVIRDHRGKTISLLVPNSPEREQALAVRRLREEGVTMTRISAGSNLSVATLRRMLTRLAVTEMLEAGAFDVEVRRAQRAAVGHRRTALAPVAAHAEARKAS